jgi:hypothetical protein
LTNPLWPVGKSAACHLLSGVHHHRDNAFDVTVRRNECADIHSEPARDRRAHLIVVKDFALDLAGLDHVLGQGLQDGLIAQRKPERFHMADQPPLPMPDRGEGFRYGILIPAELGPVGQLVDVGHDNLRIFCGDYDAYSPHLQCYSPHDVRRKSSLFAAPIERKANTCYRWSAPIPASHARDRPRTARSKRHRHEPR